MGNLTRLSEHHERVRTFMLLAGQTIRAWPQVPSKEERILRARLILEEAIELIHALGCDVYGDDPLNYSVDATPRSYERANLVEIADGCADLSVVLQGTLASCGIPDLELLRLVDENNLAKFGPGSSRRADGKLVKPPGHKPPPIVEFLESLDPRVRIRPRGRCATCGGEDILEHLTDGRCRHCR